MIKYIWDRKGKRAFYRVGGSLIYRSRDWFIAINISRQGRDCGRAKKGGKKGLALPNPGKGLGKEMGKKSIREKWIAEDGSRATGSCESSRMEGKR